MDYLFFLYGETRTFEVARKTWNVLDIPNLDIVIHTPNTTSDYLGNTDYKKVTKDDFDILDNPKVFLYDRDDYKETDLHVLHYSYRFLSSYLKTSKKYKYIFIGRLDSTFYIHDLNKFLNKNNNNLYVSQLPNIDTLFIPDHTFFGNYDVIKKFVDNLPPTEKLEKSHSDMGRYLIDMKFNLSVWDKFESSHIRPNMIEFYNKYFKNNHNIKFIDDSFFDFVKSFSDNRVYLDNLYKNNE